MGIFFLLELLMLAWGGYALFTGILKFFKTEIEGGHARLAGLILMLPVPVTAAILIYNLSQLPDDATDDARQELLTKFGLLEPAVVLACLVLAGIIALVGNSGGRRGRYWSDIDEHRADVERMTGDEDEEDDGEDPEERRKRRKKQDRELSKRLATQARENAKRRAEEAEEEKDDVKKQAERLRSKVKITRVKGKRKPLEEVEDDDESEEARRRKRIMFAAGGAVAGVGLVLVAAAVAMYLLLGKGHPATTSVAENTATATSSAATRDKDRVVDPNKDRPLDPNKDRVIDPNKDRTVDPNRDRTRPPEPPALPGKAIALDPERVKPCLVWADDGKSFYALESKPGVLYRVGVPDCQVLKKAEIATDVRWLSRSAEGLIVTVTDTKEIWVIDPETLEAKKKIPVGAMDRAVSAPSLKHAYICMPHGATKPAIGAVDLVSGKLAVSLVQQAPGRGGFFGLHTSPDGAYLFAQDLGIIYRYKLNGVRVVPEESGPDLVSGTGRELALGGDGKLICAPSSGGNHPVASQPHKAYGTYVFATKNLRQPAFLLDQGAYPQAVAFDPAASLVYANNGDTHMGVYNAESGAKLDSHKIEGGGRQWSYWPHPEGRKVVVITSTKVVYVDVPAPKGN